MREVRVGTHATTTFYRIIILFNREISPLQRVQVSGTGDARSAWNVYLTVLTNLRPLSMTTNDCYMSVVDQLLPQV